MLVHYLIIQSLDHLESVHDEADEVGEDGEQVHHVQGRRHELELAGGTEEPHRVLWARVRINGLDNLDMQVCRYPTGYRVYRQSPKRFRVIHLTETCI